MLAPPNRNCDCLPTLIWSRGLAATILCMCICLGVIGLAPQDASAQVLRLEKAEPGQQPGGAFKPKPTEPAESVRALTISPAAEPSPALKYRFWVPEARRTGGDAITNMLRANALVREVSNRQQVDSQWNRAWPQVDQPIDRFPKAEAHQYLAAYQQVLAELAQIDQATTMQYDQTWSSLKGMEVINVLFPEIQQSRHLSSLVKTQARLAIAEGRFEDAIQSIRIGFRLSEVVSHMGRSFLIGKVVSLMITQEMLAEVEVLIEQPGAPNLYWALASWPDELTSLQDATEGEMVAIEKMFYRITNLPSEPITEAAWQARIVGTTEDLMQMMGSWQFESPESKHQAAQLWAGVVVILYGDRAREASQKPSNDTQTDLSYSEAVVRNTRDELFLQLSNYFKWSLLGFDSMGQKIVTEAMFDRLRSPEVTPANLMIETTLPAMASSRTLLNRMITWRNRLLTIESLRAYAAIHGQLPEKLPDQSDDPLVLPAWYTAAPGQAFHYDRTSPTQARLDFGSDELIDSRSRTVLTLREPAARK